MTDFNISNAHRRDLELSFDPETHIYTHNGIPYKSVTGIVEDCFEKFDVDYWAPRIAQKQGMTEQQLRAQWDAKAEHARRLGTIMHNKIERYYLGEALEFEEFDDTYRLFRQFTGDFHLNPYRTEWAIFDEQLRIAGTLDFLDYTNGQFTIYDWKRSDKLISDGRPITSNRYNKTALSPIDNIPDTTYWHYALQVSIYRYILERNYGINVHKGYLAVFHPSNPTYHVIEVPYLKQEITRLFTQPH